MIDFPLSNDLSSKSMFSLFCTERANGLRYLRVGGRGQCLGAEKTRSQKNTCKPRRLPHVGCTLCWVWELEDSLAEKDTAAKLTRFLHTTLTLATTKKLTCVSTGFRQAQPPARQPPKRQIIKNLDQPEQN